MKKKKHKKKKEKKPQCHSRVTSTLSYYSSIILTSQHLPTEIVFLVTSTSIDYCTNEGSLDEVVMTDVSIAVTVKTQEVTKSQFPVPESPLFFPSH